MLSASEPERFAAEAGKLNANARKNANTNADMNAGAAAGAERRTGEPAIR
ncbi:hypothetical protein O7599_17075 [Streptomyces sp. WMMC500]|nr:hypothetical protein [Streptomyces sp. WMMC500]WBB64121.1 hypothetical protein O7599_17075 [Streptomyces sp. WMMC500]